MASYTLSLFFPKSMYIFKHTLTHIEVCFIWICLYFRPVLFSVCMHETNCRTEVMVCWCLAPPPSVLWEVTLME